MKRIITLINIFTIVILANSNTAVFKEVIKQSGYSLDNMSFTLSEADANSNLVSINGDSMLNPASVMKLITGTAGMDILGPQYTFKTSVYSKEKFNPDKRKVSSLYIKGGGDPGYTAERLWLFVMHLKHQGIDTITEDIIIDDSFFDEKSHGPGFGEDNSTRAYEAPAAATSANFNTIAIHIAPGGKINSPIHVTPFPELSGVKIINTAKTVKKGQGQGVNVHTKRLNGTTAITLHGTMGIEEEPRYRYRKIWETYKYFGWVLESLFLKTDIKFSGKIIRSTIPDSIIENNLIYEFQSEPLHKVVNSMFKYSSNFAAEMLFKTIAAEKDGIPGTWPKGCKVLKNWWKEQNIYSSAPQFSNGSGMGGGNRVSSNQIVALLKYSINQKDYFPEYLRALSIAGVDGTVETRFEKSPLKKIMRVKTGTLNSRGVSNLAGYIFLPKKTLIFSILINDKSNSQWSHWMLQQKLTEKAWEIYK